MARSFTRRTNGPGQRIQDTWFNELQEALEADDHRLNTLESQDFADQDHTHDDRYTKTVDLADVATSGAYSDLTGTPTLGDLAAKDAVVIADIETTGTADGTTYLRGDGAWTEVESGGADLAGDGVADTASRSDHQHWDGTHAKSVKIGSGAVTGINSWESKMVAIGDSSIASGGSSVAVGSEAGAKSQYAIAVGDKAAAGTNSLGGIAIGASSSSSNGGMALGRDSKASNTSSIALGFNTSAAGSKAIAVGTEADASSVEGIAVGVNSYANGRMSIAIGAHAYAIDDAVAEMTVHTLRMRPVDPSSLDTIAMATTIHLQSPNGSLWAISVDNSGNISATAV